MAKQRRFTPEFKAELVFEVLSGGSSQAEVRRKPHNLNENQPSEWKRHLLENAASLFETPDKQSSDAEKRIAHLEQLVGRMAVALDRVFDTYGISTTNLILTLRNCGLNKRMHFSSFQKHLSSDYRRGA